jgi:hypothetical protein
MTTHRTNAKWQRLLQQRTTFSSSNLEFCQRHNISITIYYKQPALFQEQQVEPSLPEETLHPTASRFVQVKQTTDASAQIHRKRPVIYALPRLTCQGNRLWRSQSG